MLRAFSWWEIGLATAILVLAAAEFWGLSQARRQGLTDNSSRLWSHGALSLLCAAFIGLTLLWTRAFAGPALPLELPVANWTYLLLAVMIGLVASHEVVALHRARRRGLTRNRSRLVTHLVMLILLAVMVGINLSKWELYLERLTDEYAESLAG